MPQNKLINYDRLQTSDWLGMRRIEEERGITEKQRRTPGAQNTSEFTNIYSYTVHYSTAKL